jgi:hypothetical protein
MLRLIGFLVLLALAIVGAYTLYNSNDKEIKEGKDKIERAYEAAKKELRK